MVPSCHRFVLVGIVVFLRTWVPGQSVAESWLVATRTLEVGPAHVTLPEKVGVLLPGEQRDLAFEVPGRLDDRVDPGTTVVAGDVVARLDATLEKAQLRQAELRMQDAESEERRLRGLRDAEATSAQRLEAAEIALALRHAEVEVAREQLARRRIVTGLAGDVIETYLDAGEVATPGSRIATVMKLDSLKLELGVPGFQIGRVREGARVVLKFPALDGGVAYGAVRRAAGATVDGGHLFEVEVVVPNEDRRLRPGMSVAAAIVTQTLPIALRIPLEAVVEREGRPVAYFAVAGFARGVPLELAIRVGDEVLVVAEFPYRELIVRGQRDLAEGLAIRVDNSVLTRAAIR